MFTPPPVPGQPVKKNNTLSIVLIVVSLACVGICGVGGFFTVRSGMNMVSTMMPVAVCTADVQKVRDALIAYHDKNGKFPKAESWMDDIEGFMKYGLDKDTKELQSSPLGGDIKPITKGEAWACQATPARSYGIAFNADLAKKKISEISDTQKTILVFETEAPPARNLAKKYEPQKGTPEPKIMGQPREWIRAPVRGEVVGFSTNSGESGLKIETNTETN